ncbi:MAG TPA: trigger factor [Bdellovibrionota bacterium]|nr:trigger factor [Bdellovibrionota bacterium]
MNVKVDIESLSPVKKKLSISVPEEMVLEEIETAYKKVGKQVQIPGFRSGKVPRTILEQRFGPAVEGEVFEELIRRTVFDAVREHDFQIVTTPQISDPKREKGSGFTYVASIEVKPAFTPKDYKEISVEKPETKVTDKQIQEVIGRLQDEQAVLKDREGATSAVKGDFVSIVLEPTDAEGNLVESKEEPKEQIYEVGGEMLHPEIEKALKKLPLGQSAPITIGQGADKEKKEFRLRVTLKAIKEKILPTLNDDFAKSVGPFENLAALKDRVKKDLEIETEENAKAEMIQELLASAMKANPVDLPESLVDSELHSLMDGFKQRMERVGMKELPEEYSHENLHKKLRPDAERRVHEQLLLEAIARTEEISAEEKEVTARLERLAAASKVPVGELRSAYEKTGQLDSIRFNILAQKTLDFLLSNAKIK